MSQHVVEQKVEALRRFRFLLELSDNPIAIYDLTHGNFVDANAAACAIMGLTQKKLSSTSASDVLARLDIEFPPDIPDLKTATERGTPFLLRFVNQQHALVTYELNTHRTKLNQTVFITLVAHNITVLLDNQQASEFAKLRTTLQQQVLSDLSLDPAFMDGDLPAIYGLTQSAFNTALKPTWSELWVRRRSNNNWFHCYGDTTSKPIDKAAAETQMFFAELRRHRPIIIEDLDNDARTQAMLHAMWPNRQGYSAVCYPIYSGGILAGIVLIWRPRPTIWHSDELSFIGHVGEYIAQGLNNFFDQRTLSATARISNAVMSMLNKPDLPSVFAEISKVAVSVIGASDVVIFTKRETLNSHILDIFRHNTNATSISSNDAIRLWVEDPEVSRNLGRNIPLMVYRETQPPGSTKVNAILAPDYYQALVMPMVYQQKLHGGLILLYRFPRRFLSGDMGVAATLAQQSLSAIEIIRIHSQLREERAHLNLLFNLNLLSTSSFDVTTIAQNALDALCKTIGASYGSLVVGAIGEQQTEFSVTFGVELLARKDSTYADLPAFLLSNQEQDRKQTRYFADIAAEPRFATISGETPNIRSLIAAPTIIGGKVAATIIVGHPDPHYFSKRQLNLIESASAAVSNAISYAQLITSERASLASERNLQALATAAQQALDVLGEKLDVDRVLDRILYHVAEVIEADVYNIILIEGDHGRIVRSRGYHNIEIGKDTVTNLRVPVFEFESFKRMIRTGEPIIVDNTRTDPRWVSTKVSHQARAYIGAAIRIGDETVGFINASSLKTGAFRPLDAQRLSLFASYVALALRNAQTYQQTSDYAADLEMRVKSRTNELQLRTKWAEAMINSTRDGIVVLNSEYDTVQSNTIYKQWIQQTLSDQDALHLRNAIHDLARGPLPTDIQLELLSGTVFDLRATQIDDEPARAILVTVHEITHLRVLDRMKSQFISDISHELRTPITTIGLYAQLMRKNTAPEHLGYLDALDTEVTALTRLVESILQVSRYEADRTLLDPKPVDLNVICAGVVGGFEPLAKAKALEFKLSLTDEPVTALVDTNAINLVLNHLVENAIAYTDTGTVRLSTSIVIERDRPWAVISVTDTGIGIPDDELTHIFERFYRGEMSRQRQISGGGMGLALADTITRQHGGYIDVSSNVNHGSTFRIFLPAANTDFALPS